MNMLHSTANLERHSAPLDQARHSNEAAGLRPLRIGFVMSTEVGLKTQYLNWRQGLPPDSGIDPEWIVIDWWKRDGLLERLPGIPSGFKARLRARWELQTGMAKGPFDALFLASERMMHGSGAALARQPYFITADTTARQLHAFGDLYAKVESNWQIYEQRKHNERRKRYQQARALFPWSHWAAQSMIEDYGAEARRVHVIPPGIDIAAWNCAQREETDRDGKTHILFVGGDFHRKGGDLLLDWASRTNAKNWVLHLVTREAIAPRENVRVYNSLTPNAPELRALYQQAHLFALPTRGDCYSLAGMEAMAAGLPVILSRTGGTGDIIIDGRTGYLIGAGDGDGLTERLDMLLANPELRLAMGQAARQDAEQRYDAHKNIRHTLAVMRSVL